MIEFRRFAGNGVVMFRTAFCDWNHNSQDKVLDRRGREELP